MADFLQPIFKKFAFSILAKKEIAFMSFSLYLFLAFPYKIAMLSLSRQ